MKLSSICLEATTTFVGELSNSLGDNSSWTVNYGTGDASRSPFLYIHVPLNYVNSAARHVRKNCLVYAGSGIVGVIEKVNDVETGRARAKQLLAADPNLELYLFPKITHVGESHITISMGKELDQALLSLQERFGVDNPVDALNLVTISGRPLFKNGKGLKTRFTIKRDPFTVYRAGFYRDEVDLNGPMAIALKVSTDLYPLVREAIGLSREAMVPGTTDTWDQHVTIGYIPQKNMIHRSYLEKMGK